MKVIVAETAGFCKGVKNALEMTLEAARNRNGREEILTFGPLIHNRQVLTMLEGKGVREENDLERCGGKKVIVRAHGIPPEQRRNLRRSNAVVVDATCKRVAKVQSTIKRFARKGYHTVIVGDEDHAEVIGLMGYTEGLGKVISSAEEVEDLPARWEKVLLVAQTTQNEEVFEQIRHRFLERYPQAVVKNTICGATQERQWEVRSLCGRVDAMVIVGGRHSGNTVRLAQVARECGAPTYHVETEAELDCREMARYATVGISAGASTPNWIMRKVVRYLESIEPDRHGQDKWKRMFTLVAYSNVYVALAAALLTVMVEALTRLPASLANAGMAAFSVFAMHTLNHYLDEDAVRLNDPERAAFYRSRKETFTAVSLAAVLAALALAMMQGGSTFLAMAVVVLLGLLYGVPLFPRDWQRSLAALKIKDIPASKTFLIPLAWSCVIGVIYHLSSLGDRWGSVAYAFWIVFLLVLVRTTLLDLLDVQGDRLGGKETLVVLLGEKRTARFVLSVLTILGASLLLGPSLGVASSFAYAMLLSVAAYVWCLKTCYKNRLKGGPLYETFIESILAGTGVLAFAWSFLA